LDAVHSNKRANLKNAVVKAEKISKQFLPKNTQDEDDKDDETKDMEDDDKSPGTKKRWRETAKKQRQRASKKQRTHVKDEKDIADDSNVLQTQKNELVRLLEDKDKENKKMVDCLMQEIRSLKSASLIAPVVSYLSNPPPAVVETSTRRGGRKAIPNSATPSVATIGKMFIHIFSIIIFDICCCKFS
jgi:flagellar motor protein MotB